MFDDEFYPTPKKVIEKMLKPYKGDIHHFSFGGGYTEKGYPVLKGKMILEPSAGKGDILDFITGQYVIGKDQWKHEKTTAKSVDTAQIYCCEREPNLKHILRDKNYRVIADDFLQYHGDYLFDIILMNPPFSNGDEHLLKAWEIMDHGEIVCLLNTETLENPFTQRRKLLKIIIEENGTVEHMGQVFKESERPTDVNVSIVRLTKVTTRSRFDFEFESVGREKKFNLDESTISDTPALKDVIGNILIQYDKIKEAFVDYMKLAELLNHYGEPLVKQKAAMSEEEAQETAKGTKLNIFGIAQSAYHEGKTKRESFNLFCSAMKENMWQIVFDNLSNIARFDMEKLMTHSIRKDFSQFVQKEKDMEFTRENVFQLIDMLHGNRDNILERCIGEVFDIFTNYYKENRCHIEGWKTNDKWKVNRKIILPNVVKYGEYSTSHDLKQYGSRFSLRYNTRSEYSDIDKALDYISGTGSEHRIGLYESLEIAFNRIGTIRTGDKFNNTGESAYFNWKFWKKGTLHIEFKDKYLWEEFNMRACKDKQWLPDGEFEKWQEQENKRNRKKSNKSVIVPESHQLGDSLKPTKNKEK